MELMRKLPRWVFVYVLLSGVWVFTPAISAAAKPTIHALSVIMDMTKNNPNDHKKNGSEMKRFLRDVTDKVCHLQLTTFQSSEPGNERKPTRDNILKWVREVKPQQNDVVFIYFSGYGGLMPNVSNDQTFGGTYLTLGRQSLYRKELVDALKAAPAWECRLKILITDSCSKQMPPPELQMGQDGGGGPHPLDHKAQVYRQLFVEHEGFLHLAAASEAQHAYSDQERGGWFTFGLLDSIDSYATAPATSTFITWDKVFIDTKREVERIVKAERAYEKWGFQNPKSYGALPKQVSVTDKPLIEEQSGRPAQSSGMVLIPAGEFQMGSDYLSNEESKPVHTVYLDAFYIDTHEVTVGEYKQFLKATQGEAYRLPPFVAKYSPTDKHPIINVSWHDAMAYAKWAGKRLPTEAEWEKAARGPEQFEHYPWEGKEIGDSQANHGGVYGEILPVGTFKPYGYGLYDMAGNVAEWCLDPFFNDFYENENSPRKNPFAGFLKSRDETIANFESAKGKRVLRGGNWNSPAINVRVDIRNKAAVHNQEGKPQGYTNVGFRCAKDAQ